jgi:hypothetical protein
MNRIRFYAYLRKGEALFLKRLFEDGPENAFAWQYPLLLKQLGDLHPAALGQSVGRSCRNIRSIFIRAPRKIAASLDLCESDA